MFTLILTIWFGSTASSVSAPNFQTLQLCEAAAAGHSAKVSKLAGKFINNAIVYSCVKTQEK